MAYVFWNWENKKDVIWLAIKFQGLGETGLSYLRTTESSVMWKMLFQSTFGHRSEFLVTHSWTHKAAENTFMERQTQGCGFWYHNRCPVQRFKLILKSSLCSLCQLRSCLAGECWPLSNLQNNTLMDSGASVMKWPKWRWIPSSKMLTR